MDQNQAQAVSNLFPVIVQALTTIAALLAAFAAFHAASKSSKRILESLHSLCISSQHTRYSPNAHCSYVLSVYVCQR